MNLAELRDSIRAEGNIEGFERYQNMIDNIINQTMQRFTGKAQYTELRTSANFVLATEQSSIALPEDFQLIDCLVYTRDNDDAAWQLAKGTNPFGNFGQQGYPQFYTRSGSNLSIYPFSGVNALDTVDLYYYKKPELVLNTDELEVPSLETAIIQGSLARILMLSDTKRAMAAKQEAQQAFVDSRAQANGQA